MKTIEVTDEMYEQLMDISKEMNTQNHRGTCIPYIYRIVQEKTRPCAEGFGDKVVWTGFELPEITNDDNLKGNFKEYLKEHGYDIPEKYNDLDVYEVQDLMESDYEFQKYDIQTYQDFKCYFLTEKAAEEHLKLNHYHYGKDAHTYIDSCWRSPDMEIVSKFLCEISGGKIHK